MNKKNSFVRWLVICLVTLLPAGGLLAQQRTTQGAGARGGGGSTVSGTSRQYTPNSEVGEATITVDPESRRLIVITDEETSKYVGQVVTNLDRPEPQVLIKVVFLEVTQDRKSTRLNSSHVKSSYAVF